MSRPVYGYINPIFPTLRSAGYQACEHYRVDDERTCMDCGAVDHGAHWVGGHLEYKRKAHRYEVPQIPRAGGEAPECA